MSIAPDLETLQLNQVIKRWPNEKKSNNPKFKFMAA